MHRLCEHRRCHRRRRAVVTTLTHRRPTTVAEAVGMLSSTNTCSVLGGGQTLIPALCRTPGRRVELVDLASIPELSRIDVDHHTATIGAMTTHAVVASHAEILREVPVLAALAGAIADPLVRNRATIGGAVADNDPAGDYPAACIGLRATVVTDRREIPADEYFTRRFRTPLAANEIVVALRFRIPRRAVYCRLPNFAMRSALAGVLIAEFTGEYSVAVTGVADTGAMRWTEAQQALSGSARSGSLLSDVQFSSAPTNGLVDYQWNLAAVLAGRATLRLTATNLRERP